MNPEEARKFLEVAVEQGMEPIEIFEKLQEDQEFTQAFFAKKYPGLVRPAVKALPVTACPVMQVILKGSLALNQNCGAGYLDYIPPNCANDPRFGPASTEELQQARAAICVDWLQKVYLPAIEKQTMVDAVPPADFLAALRPVVAMVIHAESPPVVAERVLQAALEMQAAFASHSAQRGTKMTFGNTGFLASLLSHLWAQLLPFDAEIQELYTGFDPGNSIPADDTTPGGGNLKP